MSPVQLECPTCESHEFTSLFALKSSDLVRCESCGMVYVPAPLPEVTAIYKASYFKGDHKVHGYGNYENEFDGHYKTFDMRLRSTEKIMGGKGRVLDVGCALGHFGKTAKDRGWDVFVTDVSDFAVQTAAVKYGLKGFVSPPDKLPVRNGEFDCVTMFDVLEHVSQPIELLHNAHQALHKYGILHLTTPNVKSWSARIMGRHWYHYKPEEHLLYFEPETLRHLLNRAQFEVLEIKPMPMYMKVIDILTRLRRYWEFGANALIKCAKIFGIANINLKIYAGEIEAWARPLADTRGRKPYPVDPPNTPVLDVVCCPNCRSDLVPTQDEILCTQCHSSYEIVAGVIDFSRYGKKQQGKVRKISGC